MVEKYHSAEAVANEIASRLAGITVANGYETDVGLKVFRGRRSVNPDMIPCVALIEAEDVVTDTPGRSVPDVALRQYYALMAYVACDADNPNTAAHAALRDMKRAIFVTDDKPSSDWGKKVTTVRYVSRDIGPRADGSGTVVAAITFFVEYVERLNAA